MAFVKAEHTFEPRREGDSVRGAVTITDDALGDKIFRYRIAGADFDEIMAEATAAAKRRKLKEKVKTQLKPRYQEWVTEETERQAEVRQDLGDPGTVTPAEWAA